MLAQVKSGNVEWDIVESESRMYARARAAISAELAGETATVAVPAGTLRSWAWLGAALPSLRTRAGRARWCWVLGQRVGTAEGRRRLRGSRR